MLTRLPAEAHSLLPAPQIEMMLFLGVSPNAAGNFLGMCRGDKGGSFTYVGARFYRILDAFIDQTGVEVPSLNGGSFQDDPGGLALKHDRPGLLSMANSGPNTNTNHFSILMAPAPHLDGSYTIFGEVVRGIEVTRAINKLASASGAPTGSAVVTAAGQLE
jgi:peptidyl-prolyl isomerase D